MGRRFYFFCTYAFTSYTVISGFLLIQQFIAIRNSSDHSQIGILFAAHFLPKVLLIPYGGIISDSYSKKGILVAIGIFRVIIFFIAWLLESSNTLSMYFILIISMFLGATDAICIPTATSLIPEFSKNNSLNKRNASYNSATQLGSIFGAVTISALIEKLSVSWSFFVIGMITIVGLLALWRLGKDDKNYNNEMTNIPIKNTLKIVSSLNLWPKLYLLTSSSFFFTGVLMVLTPQLAIKNFGVNAQYIGVLNATFGSGIIIYSLILCYTDILKNTSLPTLANTLGLLIVALSLTSNLPLLLCIYCAFGIIISAINVNVVTYIQDKTPVSERGKVLSVAIFTSQILLPISFGLLSFLSKRNIDIYSIILTYGLGQLCISMLISSIFRQKVRSIAD